jgi:predicted O-linked N-acetylglucosamine transferase (SPINDLY family)
MSEKADALIAQGNSAEDAGRLEEAAALYREALRLAPRAAKAHLNLGIALQALGDEAGAVACYESALALDAANPYAAYNFGKLRYERGAPAEAERLLRQALGAKPAFPEARIMLACALEAQGRLEAAAAELDAALRERPRDFGALFIQAGILRRLGRLDAAAAALRQALAIDSQHLDARAALFHVLEAGGDLEGAARELEAVLARRPGWAQALFNYGAVLQKLLRPAQAEDALRRAIAADPGFTRAYRMLGSALLGQCRIEEALDLYRRSPREPEIVSAELFALNAWETISEEELFARHAEFGRRLEQAVPARFAFSQARDPARRLRIGYVSGDFSYHVVTLFLLPVLERRDRASFEVFCYSTSERVDDYTRRLAAQADAWRPCAGLSDAQIADAIHADGIDILVDLAGHSGEPRLAVFAQKPAPVQATWLGYLNTTGLTRIDYRISDPHADPAGLTDARHTEKLARLPHSQWCYRPFMSARATATVPCAQNGYVTFGSFNQALKLSQASRRLWADILARLPGARLVVLGVPAGRAHDGLLADFAAAGIGVERLKLVPYVSLQDYYGWFNAVDIALDTTPYSGGTTTCDALWMGVPVLTVPGERPSSRSAASILATVGLGEWVASGREDYVQRALEFSRAATLANLRVTLRARMQASPLMDEAGFTKNLENVYRRMWQAYCTGGAVSEAGLEGP